MIKSSLLASVRIQIAAAERVLSATLLDNASTRALIAQFPLTVPMKDLYSREMCYRLPEALPANETTTSGYDVGDIIYWTPGRSLVIMYKQNGERISNLQKLGRVESGVEFFGQTGDIDVTFRLAE